MIDPLRISSYAHLERCVYMDFQKPCDLRPSHLTIGPAISGSIEDDWNSMPGEHYADVYHLAVESVSFLCVVVRLRSEYLPQFI
jgi:hypothetical protein